MTDTKSIPTKINRTDLPRLKDYADAHNLHSRVEAITRLLDLAQAFPNLDTLPRPEGGAVIPVVEAQQ
jgi:hypothetical protein